VLAYILTGDTVLAEDAVRIVLNFTESTGFNTVDGTVNYSGANQCALDLSWFIPLFIESAMLLEFYPGWTTADKSRVQIWLADHVYAVTSAIARTRKNNWGTAAAFASWSIAHYTKNTNLYLSEIYPNHFNFNPEEAMIDHIESQLKIIGNGSIGIDWKGDSRCSAYGMQYHGGFPNELRKGKAGCNGAYLLKKDTSYSYHIATTSSLIFHAEALRRHSQNELYSLIYADGQAMIHKAILFVIDNSYGNSYAWSKSDMGVLRVANHYFKDSRICQQIESSTYFKEGRYLPFARVLHPIACPE